MSPVHFVELKGDRFGRAIYHPSFTAEALMAWKLRKGKGTQSDPSGSVPKPVYLRTVNQSSVGLRKIFGPLDSMSSRPWIHWGIQEFLMVCVCVCVCVCVGGGGGGGVQILIQKHC